VDGASVWKVRCKKETNKKKQQKEQTTTPSQKRAVNFEKKLNFFFRNGVEFPSYGWVLPAESDDDVWRGLRSFNGWVCEKKKGRWKVSDTFFQIQVYNW
jgi:hypothetical protein